MLRSLANLELDGAYANHVNLLVLSKCLLMDCLMDLCMCMCVAFYAYGVCLVLYAWSYL